MRKHFLGIFAAILSILLVLALVSCSNQKKGDDDGWMEGEFEVDTTRRYAHPQQLDSIDENVAQSSDRTNLPTVPLP